MSISESLPWAITAGNNAGVARATMKNRDEWMNYAKQLEKQVQFYRAEAINGWAAARAFRMVAEENGLHLKEEPLVSQVKAMQKRLLPEMTKMVDNEAPK